MKVGIIVVDLRCRDFKHPFNEYWNSVESRAGEVLILSEDLKFNVLTKVVGINIVLSNINQN